MEFGILNTVQSALFLVLDLYVCLKAYREKKDNKKHRYFTLLALSASVQQLASLFVRMFKAKLVNGGAVLQYFVYIIMFAAMVFTAWGSMRYLLYLCGLEKQRKAAVRVIALLPSIVMTAAAISSPWTGWLFYLDTAMDYHRGSMFFLQLVCPYIYALAALVMIIAMFIRSRKKDESHAIRYFLCFIVPALAGMVMQVILNVDGGYSAIGTSVSVILLYTEFYVDEIRQYERQQEERSREELVQNNARLFVLEDDFESLYDVELESGRYVMFDRGDFYRRNISEKLITPVSFFENMRENIDRVVLEEDRSGVYDVQQKENILKGLEEHEHIDHYYRIITETGPMWLKMRIVYKDETKKNVIIGVFNAERSAEAKQLVEQQKRLEEALAMAEVANRAKTDFLFNMSHDIRTPMNAIIGFTNIAMKEIDNREKALDSLEKVRISSDILLNLINDVLDMSRIESGKVELHEEKYEITEAFDSFRPTMESLAASKDINLKFSVGEVRNRYIFADGPRFDRILINIISNAIKYTPAEGFVRVSADQIADTRPGFGNYRFTVADSGIGMSEEFQKHMFENFTREDNSTTRGVQGTGLGLPLAKKLVDKMGGTISCISTQGIGTTFTIILPFRLQTEADKTKETDMAQSMCELDLEGKRALLVEDNELNREIAEEILSDEGIIVETAADGQKAVNKVREYGADHYDFILMDIQMPVMNGYEATEMIRRLVPELKAPIIALSANAFAEDRKKSLEAGMDDHVAKPINVKELVAALSKFL